MANGVGGLCWTHSHLIDPMLYNYQSAINIAMSLKASKVHLGKEVTVIGVHILGEDGLYPFLLHLLASPKTLPTWSSYSTWPSVVGG